MKGRQSFMQESQKTLIESMLKAKLGPNPTTTQKSNAEIQILIIETLFCSNSKMKMEEIQDHIPGITFQRVGALTRQLISDRFVNRIEEGRNVFYEINDTLKVSLFAVAQSKVPVPVDEALASMNCECKVEDIENNAEQIGSDPKLLIEYLKQITRMETNIFALVERYKYLVQEYNMAAINALTNPKILDRNAVSNEKVINEPQAPRFDLTKPEEPVYKKPGLFNKKQIEEENSKLKSEYTKNLNLYNVAYAEYQAKEMEYKRLSTEYQRQVNENKKALQKDREQQLAKDIRESQMPIDKEMEILLNELKDTILTRNKLYSQGVIYGKYRNYVAVSTFCDYLISGRCDSLDGPNGAYNLYEQETRADIVISKLDVVLNSMERIQENQYYLFNELQVTNTSLGHIQGQLLINNVLGLEQLSTLQQIEEHADKIACNTAVTAFYSKKNSELLNAIGFMTALK